MESSKEFVDTFAFAQKWFDLLSEHAPVEQLLPFVADAGLEMAFPERTLRSHADFREWYEVVGTAFSDQTHVIEGLKVIGNGNRIDVDVVVVWTATQTSDGTRSASRVDQVWQLEQRPGALQPVIVGYRVGGFQPLPLPSTTGSAR